MEFALEHTAEDANDTTLELTEDLSPEGSDALLAEFGLDSPEDSAEAGPASPEPADPDGDFLDLDDLIAEATAEADAKRAAVAGRARLKRLPVGSPEAAAIRAKVEEWEARREWNAEAQVALFRRTHCQGCGRTHLTFSGFMRRESHKTKLATRRWVELSAPGGVETSRLPKETAFVESSAPVCWECAGEAGWPGVGEVVVGRG